ncbi:MAG: DUF1573 domain-containing protein [Bacteroidia bacterium]|nr:DUF1573 domain-containing protein [Bacteroidia bacterium]
MNKFVFLFCAMFLFLLSCEPGKESKGVDTDIVNIPTDGSGNTRLPVISFDHTEHDFGTVTDGEKVTYNFRFTNTGESDLVITSAKGSCGCTVADPPAKPVPPGGEGYISVTFDSQGREGFQKKEVTVVTNCQPNTKILQFRVNVIKAEDKK